MKKTEGRKSRDTVPLRLHVHNIGWKINHNLFDIIIAACEQKAFSSIGAPTEEGGNTDTN
jgi:hypothetical protein